MTKQETARLLLLIKSEYPNAFNKLNKNELKLKAELWCKAFADYDYQKVENALTEYVMTNQSGFAPTIGQLNGIMVEQNKSQEDQLDAYSAWNLLTDVMSSGEFHYNPQETFNKLPAKVKRCVGNADILRDWAITDYSRLSFIQNDFYKRYQTMDNKADYDNLIPENLKLKHPIAYIDGE